MENTSLKDLFLEEKQGQTKINYQRIFNHAKPFEEEKEKDLKDFTLEEIGDFLCSLNLKRRNTAETYGRIISSYLAWCKEYGYSTVNVMKPLKPSDFDQYVTNKQRIITIEQLLAYEKQCVNFQDALILRLLYIGVGGKYLSEIRHLKKTDLIGNQLTLTNVYEEDEKRNPIKFTKREITIDDRTKYLIEGAIHETRYMKKNGVMSELSNVVPYTELVDNEYVIRASHTKNNYPLSAVDLFVLYRRIDMIQEYFGEPFTTKLIQRSGMTHLAMEIFQQTGNFDNNDLRIVSSVFQVTSYHNAKSFLDKKYLEALMKEGIYS